MVAWKSKMCSRKHLKANGSSINQVWPKKLSLYVGLSHDYAIRFCWGADAAVRVVLRGRAHLEWKVVVSGDQQSISDDQYFIDERSTIWGKGIYIHGDTVRKELWRLATSCWHDDSPTVERRESRRIHSRPAARLSSISLSLPPARELPAVFFREQNWDRALLHQGTLSSRSF